MNAFYSIVGIGIYAAALVFIMRRTILRQVAAREALKRKHAREARMGAAIQTLKTMLDSHRLDSDGAGSILEFFTSVDRSLPITRVAASETVAEGRNTLIHNKLRDARTHTH